MATFLQVQSNYTCGAALKQSLSDNNYLVYHNEILDEKIL
jgi:hypothetical protein